MGKCQIKKSQTIDWPATFDTYEGKKVLHHSLLAGHNTPMYGSAENPPRLVLQVWVEIPQRMNCSLNRYTASVYHILLLLWNPTKE